MAHEDRIQELLNAVDDVVMPTDAPLVRHIGQASLVYQRRFERYLRELRDAKRWADSWWSGLIESEAERVGNRDAAEINVKTRRVGAVVNPVVINCLRSAWLDCHRLNQQHAEPDRVAPEAFVLLWLHEASEHELARFLAALPFWPMGQDAAGNWI